MKTATLIAILLATLGLTGCEKLATQFGSDPAHVDHPAPPAPRPTAPRDYAAEMQGPGVLYNAEPPTGGRPYLLRYSKENCVQVESDEKGVGIYECKIPKPKPAPVAAPEPKSVEGGE